MIHFHLPMRICSSICSPPKCGEKLTTLPLGDACHQGGPTTRVLHWGFRLVFGFDFGSGFDFCWGISFLVPVALYLQQFGTRICHFAWYLLEFGMVTFHFAWYLLQLAMFAFQFAWYLRRFGTSTSHLHGICYILVLQPFMWVSWEFL